MVFASTPLNAFTVDVEDYFQVTGFEHHISRDSWETFDYRVVANTRRILALLAKKQVRGTFYILGWIAQKSPELVREIHAAGHEIGSHSYWHRLVYSLSPEEFRRDLVQSREAIFNACGQIVTAYRAPSFSITTKSLWALPILAEEGFTLDSSIFPTRHDRYGIPHAPQGIHEQRVGETVLREFPATVANWGGLQLPVGGGGYFRLYPWWFTHYLLRRVNREPRPFMFYVHPWEVDPAQPRFRFGSWGTRFRHYVNLAGTEQKLERLLDSFRFGTMTQVVACQGVAESARNAAVETPSACESV